MTMMTSYPKNLSIDLETYSSVDLAKSGVYRYVESSDFEILLFAYSIDGNDVQVVDLANGEVLPPAILLYLKDDKVTKWAFNAIFERVCLSKFLGMKTGTYLSPSSWKCTLTWSAYLGLPLSLKGVGSILKLDKQKLDEGKDLIKFFCTPCLPTKVNNGRTRNRPYHAVAKWELFKSYNKRDVEVEMAIQGKLSKFTVPDFVWDEYHIDQEINDRGIKVDLKLVNNAITLDGSSKEEITRILQVITELENPNSVAQMKMWLEKNGIKTSDLGKKNVTKLKSEIDDEEIIDVLGLRQQLAKSSIKKYQAMKNAVCSDGRIRGMFMFYGANRTGRFCSKIVQLQNLPANHLPDLEEARDLLENGNSEAINTLYSDIPDTLSQLIRTSFIPEKGYRFFVADYSAIEARVLAWLAGEAWRLKAFEEGADIYSASASKMFGVPVVKHGINGELRQKGKISELANGYGGSVGALKAMGALEMGLTEDELAPLVRSWREANPNIVKFWWSVDDAVKKAIKSKTTISLKNIKFSCRSGMLFITLPSGRTLSYVKPRIVENKYGSESVTYEGVGTSKKWERLESYGPKFVENIVQGIARDILCNAMKNLKNYRIVAHVHDELIIEAPSDTSLDYLCNEMSKLPTWADGLILRADGYVTDFYKKD